MSVVFEYFQQAIAVMVIALGVMFIVTITVYNPRFVPESVDKSAINTDRYLEEVEDDNTFAETILAISIADEYTPYPKYFAINPDGATYKVYNLDSNMLSNKFEVAEGIATELELTNSLTDRCIEEFYRESTQIAGNELKTKEELDATLVRKFVKE